MRSGIVVGTVLLAGSLLVPGVARAQFPVGGGGYRAPRVDNSNGLQFNIKRRTVSGVVKTLNTEKKTLLLERKSGDEAKEIPIDVGPSLIKAGPGRATYADIQVGDKIEVYGETTVHGGVRAMEITLPKERMSIAPPSKEDRKRMAAERRAIDKKIKEEQKAIRAEEKIKAAEKKKADEEQRRKDREAEKLAKEEEKKAKEEEKLAKEQEKQARKNGAKVEKEDKEEKDDKSEKAPEKEEK